MVCGGQGRKIYGWLRAQSSRVCNQKINLFSLHRREFPARAMIERRNWTSHRDAANKTSESLVRLEKRGCKNYLAEVSGLWSLKVLTAEVLTAEVLTAEILTSEILTSEILTSEILALLAHSRRDTVGPDPA
jgi:hypothetical protein